jgi:pimeloyl-ACP methyl ester carboxylesterase
MAGAGVRDILIDGPWRHRDIAANGIRFHVAVGEHFDPTRPLILLLHGFCEFWWAWRHQLPALDVAGFAVAAMDLRGYGASDKTPSGYDPRTTAADVAGVIRSLGFASAIVVGHDWGGMAAWSTVTYAPAQVESLVVLAAPHPLAFPWRRDLRAVATRQLPVYPERRMVADDGRFVEELLRSQAGRRDFLSTEEARHYRDALLLWPSPHCALEYQRVFVRNQLRSSGRDYRRALHEGSTVPLLSIHGLRDPVVPAAAMYAAEPFVGRHRMVTLPLVGHYPHEEDPAAVTGVIIGHLGVSTSR